MSESNTTNQLPSGWVRTDIGTLGNYINGRGFGKSEWKTAGVPIIRIQNLNDESASFNYSNQDHEEKYKVKDGDLLVAWAASLGVFKWNRGPAWLNQHIFRVEPEKRLVRKEFLFYALQGAIEGLYRKAHGSGMVHVTRDKFDSYPINLPPLKEQKRIVSKIDELFSEIEEGERALEKVRTLVERYRQSVLKAAVTGELTRDWREKHKDQLESGEALLARILKARREAWETAELAKMKAKGQKPANDLWKAKYKEPIAPDISSLPVLPDDWTWAAVDQLCSEFGNGLSKKPQHSPPGVPILRISAVRPLSVNETDLRYYAPEENEKLDSYYVHRGDILFTRYNGSAELVGVSGIYEGNEPVLHPDKLIRASVVSKSLVEPQYLALCMNAGESAKHIRAWVKTSAGQHGIAGSDIKRAPVPLPPLDEQREIVEQYAVAESMTEVGISRCVFLKAC